MDHQRKLSIALVVSALVGGPVASQDDADKPAERVLGGVAASIDEFPWQVALVRDGESLFNGQYCGGSVIAPRWVLTAGHCVDGQTPQEISVYYGSASLEGGGQLVDVTRMIAHPSYIAATARGIIEDDVALIELAAPIAARPVRLATPEIAAAVETPGRLAVVTGWGEYRPIIELDGELVDVATGLATDDPAANFPGARFPTELQSVAVPIVDTPTCADGMREFSSPVDERVLCAGAIRQGFDACNGDSGGPLQIRDAEGRYVQIGLVSWGPSCDSGGYYNAYMRVSEYAGWIRDIMEGGDGEVESDTDGGRVLTATFGDIDLVAGFRDDPVSVELAAGGGELATRLGGECRGHIASSPDVTVHYEASDIYPLHVSVVSNSDTTLVVMGPGETVTCADDVSGQNPAVSFDSPQTGGYRIWVGTYLSSSEAGFPEATLYVSELRQHFGD